MTPVDHGGTDPGATYGALMEKTITLSIAKETARLCALSHHIPVLTRTTDDYVSITARAQIANVWQCNLCVSIHCNADPDPDEEGMKEAHGSEVWVYPGSVKGITFGQCVEAAALKYFPQRKFRGIKESERLGILRLTHMPAALIEVGFIDTQESIKLANIKTQQRIAEAITEAVNEYAGGAV